MGSRAPARRLFAPAGFLIEAAERRPLVTIYLAAAVITLLALVGGPSITGLIGLSVLIVLILVYPVIGLGAILISAPTYLLLTPFIPRGMPFSFLLLLLTATGLAFRRVYEPRSAPFRWTWVDGMAAFLLANGLLYIPMATNLKTGLYGYHELLRLFLIYFVARLLAPGPAVTRALLWCIGLTTLGVVAYGCIQPFWGYEYIMMKYDLVESLRDYAGFTGNKMRAHSILVSPLSLGYIGMMGALCAVAILSVPKRDDVASAAAPLLLALSIGASALSYTRSSWLGLAAGLIAAFVMVFRGRDRLLLLAAPFAIAMAVNRFIPALAEKVGKYALTIVSQDPTDTSLHYVALYAAAQYFMDNLLGVGMGSASFAGFQHGTGVKFWSENTYFLMGIQTGFQGLLALTSFLVLAGLAGFRLSRTPAAGRMGRRLGAAAFMGFIGFSVAGISIPVLLDINAFGPLWLIGALVVNHHDTPHGAVAGRDGAI